MDNYTWELIKNQMAMDITQFACRLEENAEKNWLPSQVKMLRALIKSTAHRTDYSEEYEKIQREP
jgi:hypothetical protein